MAGVYQSQVVSHESLEFPLTSPERRWVRYINLLFSQQAPPSYLSPQVHRVRLVSVTMYLTPPTSWQRPVTHLLAGSSAGRGKAWASVARYNDDYVEELLKRGGSGSGVDSTITWGGVGGEGKYDKDKMFKSCGKMVSAETSDDTTNVSDHSQETQSS